MNENQVGVILEEVRDMFKALAEGQDIIENKINRLEEGQNRLEGRMDRLEGRVDILDGRMDRMEGRMDRMEKDVKIIKSYVAAIDDGINDHERRITAVEKKTASL